MKKEEGRGGNGDWCLETVKAVLIHND